MPPNKHVPRFLNEDSDSVMNQEVSSVSGSGWDSSLSKDLDYGEEEDFGSEHLTYDADREFATNQRVEETFGEYAARLCRTKIEAMPNTREVDDAKYMAPFIMEELSLGKFLGQGEFSNVFAIDSISLKNHLSEGEPGQEQSSSDPHEVLPRFSVEQNQARRFLKKNVVRSTGQNRYAIKYLKRDLQESDPEKCLSAAQDLALEAYFLKRLEHPNIMKMRGFAAFGTDGFAQRGRDGFFLILDCLSETLETRITRWAKEKKHSKRMMKRFLKKMNPDIKRVDLLDQFKIAYGISSAMQYLHDRNIIYRDLKPANIGFDVRGDVKLFDFGLAKQLPRSKDMNEDTFRMSHAGSLRYMAPEVITHDNYNLKADVYSFAILLWEILALKKPYEGYESDMFYKLVIEKQVRPTVNKAWPSPISDIILMCFDRNFDERPQMLIVKNVLRFQIEGIEGSDENSSSSMNCNHSRRRSLGSIGTVGTSVRRQNPRAGLLRTRKSDPFL